MPTLLEIAGVEIPETVQAPSIAPCLQDGRESVNDLVVTSVPLYNIGERTGIVDDMMRDIREISPSTITTDEWTLLYGVAGDPIELYHNPSDPQQERNVAEQNQEVAEELHRQFVRYLENAGTDEALLQPRRSLR